MSLTLLKLGGSLITDKAVARTLRPETLNRIAHEIAAYHAENPDANLIIGHGSGSFGHIPAKKYRTRAGVRSAEDWRGFAEVHAEATLLNRAVLDALRNASLPVLSFVPMDSIRAKGGMIESWDQNPIWNALKHGLIPVVFGDTVFDLELGGTIFSTEDLFLGLIGALPTQCRVLLAGIEDGIYTDFPDRTRLIPEILLSKTLNNYGKGLQFIQASSFPDVTGGMASKFETVGEMLSSGNVCEALIFSGDHPDNVRNTLCGERLGTRVALSAE